MNIPEGNSTSDNPIRCCLCLNLKGGDAQRTPATTIINGYAICDDHVVLMEHHDFNFSELVLAARRQRRPT